MGSWAGPVVELKTGWFCSGNHSTSSFGVADLLGSAFVSSNSKLNLILAHSRAFELLLLWRFSFNPGFVREETLAERCRFCFCLINATWWYSELF